MGYVSIAIYQISQSLDLSGVDPRYQGSWWGNLGTTLRAATRMNLLLTPEKLRYYRLHAYHSAVPLAGPVLNSSLLASEGAGIGMRGRGPLLISDDGPIFTDSVLH